MLSHADCQNILITKDTKDTVQARSARPSTVKEGDAGGGPCVRARRTSGPEACRAWRASHATLWFLGSPSGDSRRPICPIGPIGPTATFRTASVGKPPITQIRADYGPATAGRTASMLLELGALAPSCIS